MRTVTLLVFAAAALAGCDQRMDNLQMLKDCRNTTIWIDQSGQKWIGLIPYRDYVSRVSPQANIAELCP